MKNEDYFTLTNLKERGWTDAKIKNWLGDADLLKDNPRYRSAPQMRLYLKERVLSFEKNNLFIEWKEKSKERRLKQSNRMKERMENERKKLFNYIDSIDIKIPSYEKEELYLLAVEHYNDLWAYRGNCEKYASIDSDEEFLNRISNNMLRHAFSDYEYELDRLFGKVGKIDGYYRLKDRINKEIYDVYPFLKDDL